MKKLLSVLLCFCFVITQAQQTTIHKTITDLENKGTGFRLFNLFATQGIRQTAQLGTYTALQVNRTAISELYTAKPEQIDIDLPVDGTVWQLRFTRSHILSDTKFVLADATGEHTDTTYIPGVFYHGIIKNMAGNSFATASVFNGSIHLFVSHNGKNVQAGPVNDQQLNTTEYGSFSRLPGNNEPFPFDCGTTDGQANNQTIKPALTNPIGAGTGSRMDVYTGRVVRVFFDCSFAYYQHYSSNTATCFNRITTLFNQTALCYANESINTAISQIRVWTSTDPYSHGNRTVGLATFKNSVRNSYTGNLAMLCDWQPTFNSGLADGFGLLCQPWVDADTDGPYIYNDMNYNNTFYNFPVGADAPQTYLMIHEMGHILGSRHTQWCGWSGGPIDNCAAVENGPCTAGPTPSQGTMMSYCCTSSIGIDFNAGFGSQPGNVIRNHINAVSCLSNGASICDSSLYLQGSITNSDYTTFEVSNTITTRNTLSASANVVFDGGRKVDLMPGFLAPQGSLLRVVNEGCGGIYRQGSTNTRFKQAIDNKQ